MRANPEITKKSTGAELSSTSMPTAHGKSIWVVLLALLILTPTFVFIAALCTLPNDSNNLVFDFSQKHTEGLKVDPIVVQNGGVLPGDRLLGLEGRPLEAWLGDIFLSVSRETSQSADSLQQTVFRNSHQVILDAPLGVFPLSLALKRNWSMFFFAAYLLAISLFVFVRRPHDLGARMILLLAALVFGNIYVFSLGIQVSELRQPWLVQLWLWHCIVMGQMVLVLALHMSLVFPHRHPLLGRFPILLFLCYLGVWLVYGGFLLLNWSSDQTMAERFLLIIQGTVVTPVIYFPLTLAAWATNYMACKEPAQRRQIAWILWGMVVGLVAFMALALVPALLGPRIPLGTNFALVGIFLCAIPTTATIAILKERLFDINLIVNRTLVYVPLTSILAGVYAASMSILPKTFSGNSAAVTQTSLVLTTLILTTTFNPIKNWLQALVDRGFKEVPDPLKRLHEFDREILGISRIIDVNQISRRFLEESMATMQAQCGVIHMVCNQQWTTIHHGEGEAGDAILEVPLICNNIHLGTLMLGKRRYGREYGPEDRSALQQTAEHVAVVVAILQSAGAVPPEQFRVNRYPALDLVQNGKVAAP